MNSLPVPGGNDHPALGVQGDLGCTAKHDLEARISPILPHSLPLGATIRRAPRYVNCVKCEIRRSAQRLMVNSDRYCAQYCMALSTYQSAGWAPKLIQ